MVAGSIDQLNFEVILNDNDFKKTVEDDINKAEQLNTTIGKLMSMKVRAKQIISAASVNNAKNVNKELDGIMDKMRNLPTGTVLANSKEIENLLRQILGHMDKMPSKANRTREATTGVNKELRTTVSFLRDIERLTGVAFGVIGMRRFIDALVDATGQFEVQKMALTSMLQSAELADEIFNTLRKNALESPYTFQDLTKYAKQLTAFNIASDQLVETEKRLADVAAGLGVDLGRIILAYGQVKAAGVLKGTELRQFTEAGVPLLQSLAEQIEEVEGHTISLSEVFQRITKKQIPFEMVEEAFKRMTDEGGKFYNMQGVLVETLQGKIGKLRDVWQQSLYDMGMANEATLKGAVDLFTNLVSHLESIGNIIKVVVLSFGAYYSALLLVATAQKALALATLVKDFIAFSRAVGIAEAATLAFGTAAKATAVGLGLITAILATVAVAVHNARKREEQYARSVAETTSALDKENKELERLVSLAEDESKSMKQRQDAIDNINAQYAEYLHNMGIEKVSVDNLATSYDALRDAIANKYLEQLREQTVAPKQTEMNDASTALNQFNTALLKKTGEKGALSSYGRGYVEGEVEKFIKDHPLFDRQRMTEELVKIYKKYGFTLSNAEKGDLYALVENYQNAGAGLQKAKKSFEDFAQGYKSSMELVQQTNEDVVQDEDEPKWTPLNDDKVSEEVQQIDKLDKEIEDALSNLFDINVSEFDRGNKALDKKLDEREKALTDYAKFVGKLAATGMKSGGSGLSLKVSDLIMDYKDADYKVLEEYTAKMNGLRTMFSETSDEFKNGKAIIDAWRKSMEDANKSDFYEKVRGLSDEIVKEGMVGFDLSDWGDKSISQIEAIRDALRQVEVPPELRKQLEEFDELLQLLIGDVDDLKKETEEETIDPERLKKIVRAVKSVAGSLKEMLEPLKEYAEESGKDNLAAMAEGALSLADGISSVAKGFSSGGTAGAIAAGVAWIAKTILQARIEVEKLNNALATAREEARAARMEESLSAGVDTIFGTDQVRSLQNAVSLIRQLRQEMSKYANMQFNTTKKSWFWGSTERALKGESRFNQATIEELAKSVGGDLYDAYNNLNATTLQVILDTYENLDKEQREWIEHAIHDSDAYAAAMEQVETAVKGVFGDITSQAAGQIVDSWVQAGNAALDYADILDDVARAYAEMLIQSTMMETIFDPITEDLKKAFMDGRYSDAMEMIAGAMQAVGESAPVFKEILTAFDPYFKREAETGGDGVASLGAGIKSITEDTANLLASYINAIRADVSYMRLMQETGWQNVAAIAGAVASPTLNEYLAQCAAHSFDIAESNRSILAELQSVIGAPDTAGMVVRVQGL